METVHKKEAQGIINSMVHLAGINYSTCDLHQLEQVHIHKDKILDVLIKIKENTSINDLVLISTCNRVELIASGDNGDISRIFYDYIINDNKNKIPYAHIYSYDGLQAVKHIFKLASGLDSAIIGETQITSQVKDAYELSLRNGFSSKNINKLFQKSFNVAKLVRYRTSVTARSVSLSNIALKIANRIFPSVHDINISVFGSGEIGKDVINVFSSHKPKNLFVVTHRNIQKETLPFAQFYHTEEKEKIIQKSDIIITATYSDGWIISKEEMPQNDKPLLILDLSIPRVIDPACSELDELYLYNLDDLTNIARANIEKRKGELDLAMSIIDQEADSFTKELNRINELKG